MSIAHQRHQPVNRTAAFQPTPEQVRQQVIASLRLEGIETTDAELRQLEQETHGRDRQSGPTV